MQHIRYAGYEEPKKPTARTKRVYQPAAPDKAPWRLDHAAIRKAAADGVARAEIARRFKCAPSTVTQILGVKSLNARSRFDRDKAVALLLEGYSHGYVAKKLGCGRSSVMAIAATLELNRRPGRKVDRRLEIDSSATLFGA